MKLETMERDAVRGVMRQETVEERYRAALRFASNIAAAEHSHPALALAAIDRIVARALVPNEFDRGALVWSNETKERGAVERLHGDGSITVRFDSGARARRTPASLSCRPLLAVV